VLISENSEEHDTTPGTVRWSAAGRWKTYVWIAKQTWNILNLVTDVESSSGVERKNKLKKTIKKKKDEEEANKVPLITFTVAAVGECIRTLPFNLFGTFFSYKICFFFCSQCRTVRNFHLSTHSGNYLLSFTFHSWLLMCLLSRLTLWASAFLSHYLTFSYVSCDTGNSDSFPTHRGAGHLYDGDTLSSLWDSNRIFTCN